MKGIFRISQIYIRGIVIDVKRYRCGKNIVNILQYPMDHSNVIYRKPSDIMQMSRIHAYKYLQVAPRLKIAIEKEDTPYFIKKIGDIKPVDIKASMYLLGNPFIGKLILPIYYISKNKNIY
jgi:hypothetical protein